MSLDLQAFVTQANALNEPHRGPYTTQFPKAPSRWLWHDAFIPRPLALTRAGGLRWRVGATLDVSCTRALCIPHYGVRGGRCYDPASLFVLAVAAKMDQYVDYAHLRGDLHHKDKGRRYRALAGLHAYIPGQDDFCHFRSHVGDEVVHNTLAVMVELLRRCIWRCMTHDEAQTAVFEYIEVFYNRQRCHSATGYLAPLVYEQTLKTSEIFCPEKC